MLVALAKGIALVQVDGKLFFRVLQHDGKVLRKVGRQRGEVAVLNTRKLYCVHFKTLTDCGEAGNRFVKVL